MYWYKYVIIFIYNSKFLILSSSKNWSQKIEFLIEVKTKAKKGTQVH